MALPALPAFLAAVIGYMLSSIVIKFLILMSFYVALTFLIPYLIQYVSKITGFDALAGALGSLPPEVWFFLDAFALDFGIPLMISAFVVRFLIRRLPLIG